MSTDDSVSEDVSSSGALSHGRVSADGDVCKESETSLVSSEGTSVSGLVVSEERHVASQTPGGTMESRAMDITPACNKIRSLCLGTDEVFEQGKSLPFINPSSLETLRALVKEIQSSGETDPEIWKDCEGRWLHLFQLVEKQYQEQILAQQEQYQCQMQLIQDEIKALVQLQNRQASVQTHADFSPTHIKTPADTKDYILPLISRDAPRNVASDNDSLAAPALSPFSSPSPPPQRPDAANQAEERVTTVLSSGYGTLSTWEAAGSPGEDEHGGGQSSKKNQWSSSFQEEEETTVTAIQQEFPNQRRPGGECRPPAYKQGPSGTNQPLTSWAQRQKLWPKKSKAGPASAQTPECPEEPDRDNQRQPPLESCDPQDQHQVAGPLASSLPLRRSDSLMSEASGLTYWRLHENDLYRPLPDSFDSGAYHLLQEATLSLTPPQEPQLSLKEIYQNKQRTDFKRSDWEGSVNSTPPLLQVLSLDPSVNMRHSDRTSGFTSPSRFSSPSFATQPQLAVRPGIPATPDSINPGDVDLSSDSSSVSAAGAFPSKMQSLWGNVSTPATSTSQEKAQPCCSYAAIQHRRASAPLASEEEGSRTYTSTLKPNLASGATPGATVSPHMERASSLEDPIVLSLLRQNLREKHARHVADLKAYYESEIQILKDKLQLSDLPRDLEESNQALTERCRHLEEALTEATKRIKELEATNHLLEKKLAEWPERYMVAGATVKSLQQRLEESKRWGKEKETLAARLKARVRHLEEAEQKACSEADEREARREREYKMLQDLLGEYDLLVKEHEALKNNLVSTENKLLSANDQISELKRIVSKLESQVKQLEHESQARARHSSHSNTQPSGAGLFHHPDLLLSPSKHKVEPDVTRWKVPCSASSQPVSGRKSPFLPQQSSIHKAASHASSDSSPRAKSLPDASSSFRCASPPECELVPPPPRLQEPAARQPEPGSRRDGTCVLTPMMRALIELEEIRATASRAPWVGSQRATVGFMGQKHREQERVGVQASWDADKPSERRGAKSRTGPERGGALLRPQRSLSPEGCRSSSLPPSAQSNIPATSPTKRETLLMPLSAKSSPKRCPTENYSTAFGHMMPREEYLQRRFDGQVDQRRHSFHSSPRKRLHFVTAEKEDADAQQPESPGGSGAADGDPQLGWEERGACNDSSPQDASNDASRPRSLAEAEKMFDELTQEKLQIEAALSRMPASGARMSMQTRLDEVALEQRLERLNRELGSIRMILKRFHVLRSSANT